MKSDLNRVLAELSREELEHLLAAKNEIEQLESRRDTLRHELAEVEAALERLVGGVVGPGGTAARRRRSAPGASRRTTKTSAKKAAKKPAKKPAKKRARKSAKKASKKAPAKAGTPAARRAAKKAAARTTRKTAGASARRGASPGGGTLEDVIVRVLQEQGEPMPFKSLLETIVGGKLFVSRSKNFANVLRRTLSTSDRVKRVARGVYAL